MHWKWRVRLGLLAGFLLLQIWPYEAVSNPPERGQAPMPAEIQGWVRESCFDCHSHQVRFPWYASLAPFSWWIADDVRRGRAGLNFSTWSDYTPRRRALAWRRSLQRIREYRMPPVSYQVMHPGAISERELQGLENYLKEHERTEAAGLSAAELLAWPASPLVESDLPVRGAFRVTAPLHRPLRLEQALILADGDLVAPAGVSGSGAILATGKLSISGMTGAVGPLALLGQQEIRLNGAPRCRLRGLLLTSGSLLQEGLELERQSSFAMSVAGVLEARLEFCRDDGQLGERLERQVVVRYGHGQFVLWDPEFQTVRRASSVEGALLAMEGILGCDPATSLARWKRHFRGAWKSRLEQLARSGPPALLQLRSDDALVPLAGP